MRCLFFRAHQCQLLKIGASCVIKAHGSFPGSQLVNSRTQVDQSIVKSGHRSVARSSLGDQTDPGGNFLGGTDTDRRDAAIDEGGPACLRDCELSVDLVKMAIDHEIDANA